MPNDSLPPQPGEFLESRLTEDMFRRYEPLLARAVTAFPAETSFTVPPDISPTTFVARFRDARFSFLKFGWPSTTVDRNKLISIQGKYTISLDPSSGLVWFRAKQRKGRPTEFITEATVSALSAASPVRWQDHTAEELRALCLLLSNKKLNGPIIISGQVDPKLTESLPLEFDVSLVYQSDTNETVVM